MVTAIHDDAPWLATMNATNVAYASPTPSMWSVLFLTLPTQPSAVRLRFRVWRAR
jgi:hypothetical protein